MSDRNARQPFRRCWCPAPPVNTQTNPPLPCSAFARARTNSRRYARDSYSGHSPTLPKFNHRRIKAAPGASPASTELPRLEMIVAWSVTLVADVTPQPANVCPSLPARHSFHGSTRDRGPQAQLAISGDRRQKRLPYPSCAGFSDSAPSLTKLTGKGFNRPSRR